MAGKDQKRLIPVLRQASPSARCSAKAKRGGLLVLCWQVARFAALPVDRNKIPLSLRLSTMIHELWTLDTRIFLHFPIPYRALNPYFWFRERFIFIYAKNQPASSW